MKKLIVLMLLVSAVLGSQNVFAQKCEKEVEAKSEPLLATRGKNKNIIVGMKNGQRIYLRDGKIKKRGQAPACMISMYNEVDQDVDIYVDGNYLGSLQASKQGVIETLEKYEKVYCVSSDKKMSWTQHGDCACTYVFKLQK